MNTANILSLLYTSQYILRPGEENTGVPFESWAEKSDHSDFDEDGS